MVRVAAANRGLQPLKHPRKDKIFTITSVT